MKRKLITFVMILGITIVFAKSKNGGYFGWVYINDAAYDITANIDEGMNTCVVYRSDGHVSRHTAEDALQYQAKVITQILAEGGGARLATINDISGK